jgi:hypothetical protein
MRVAEIQPGDVVKVDKKGRVFYALVVEVLSQRNREPIKFEPLCPNNSYRTARPRDVVGHWRKAGRFRREAQTERRDQPALL